MAYDGFSRIQEVSYGGKNASSSTNIGRVYAVILDDATPSKEIFKAYGGWDAIGTIFYLDYVRREDYTQAEIIDKINKNYFSVARPAYSNNHMYPLVGELVSIENMPSPVTPLSKNVDIKYYTGILNYWNNSHHNADIILSSESLGANFTAKDNIKSLLLFEGDHVIEGRNGSGIRLSSTAKKNTNWWNNGREEGDPITILSNGYTYNSSSLKPHVEDIMKDSSFVILTSTQSIPINSSIALNPLTKPITLDKYSGAQATMVSDRIVLNSKKDDILLVSNQNIEIASNIINLDASNRVTLSSPYVILGLDNNKLPTNPALLGTETYNILLRLLESLGDFSSALSSAVSTPQGSPIIDVTVASVALQAKIEGLVIKLDKILSNKVFIAK